MSQGNQQRHPPPGARSAARPSAPAHGQAPRLALAAILLALGPGLAPRTLASPSSNRLRLAAVPVAGNLDVRINARDGQARALASRGAAAAQAAVAAVGRASAIELAIAELEQASPGLVVELSGRTGAPELVHNPRGALTAEAPGRAAADLARRYLVRHRAAFGLTAEDLASLEVLGDSPGGARSGLRMLRLEQRLAGVPVFQSESRFLFDRRGRLWRVVSGLVPGAAASAPSFDRAGLLAPAEALVQLLETTGVEVAVADVVGPSSAGDPAAVVALQAPSPVQGTASARMVWFPLAPGVLVPAWSLVAFTAGAADWYAVVDAESGEVLWRKNLREELSAHDAQFRVFVQADGRTPADSPAPGSPTNVAPGTGSQFAGVAPSVVSMAVAMDPVASPNGWIDDCPAGGCTANETQTVGNNVLACLDRIATPGNADVCDSDAASRLDGNGRPTGNPDGSGRNRNFHGTSPRDFDGGFLPPPQGGNPESGQTATGDGNGSSTAAIDSFRRGAVTQAFYVTNWYHDRLFALGFDEGAGNFQQLNPSGSGVGGDRVLVDVQDGGSSNNSRFSTPPDGTSGRAELFRFTGPAVDRDAALDSEVVLHELTHGLSNRLIGNAAGLLWDPGRAMGEGWSDFYALALLNGSNADSPDGRYAAVAYSTYKFAGLTDNYVYGIREFPYSTDNAVNPLTWADVDDVTRDASGGLPPSPLDPARAGGMEVHNAGVVWALSLWEVRARVIADPAGANGDVPAGNETMLALVTDALKMTPATPSFIAGRDALFAADCATNGCANEVSLWAGFADRGLGYRAAAPLAIMGGRFVVGASHMGIRESFAMPYLDVVDPLLDVSLLDSAEGNGDGRPDPGELVSLIVTLTNPWRGSGRVANAISATLASSTPGIGLLDGQSVFPDLPAQASGTNQGDPFVVRIPAAAACGQRLRFTVTTSSSLGVGVAAFELRVGTPGGPGPVVSYSATTNLAIPDARGEGVAHSLEVADDFEIADVDFRLGSLTHTRTGDLTVMLRAPGGYGGDLIWRRGLANGQFDADDFFETLIDDDLAVVAGEDLMVSPAAAAPFTGDWLPAYNSPSWDTLPVSPPVSRDPVGDLGRLDGTSTAGTWSINVADVVATNVGTLGTWGIRVQPRLYTCSAYTGELLGDGFETGDTALWDVP